MVYVKICGITNLEDARCATDAGADFLGFIFYPKSPRYIAPERVGDIVQAIRAEFAGHKPRFVGVFVDEPVEIVHTIIEIANLDFAQLHGMETRNNINALSPYAFKALRPKSLAEAQAQFQTYSPSHKRPPSTVYHLPSSIYHPTNVPDLLVDAYHPHKMGGTGQVADLDIARWLSERCQLLLAGGLTSANVADAIAQVKPWGVDVSSGVEASKGKKDHKQVRVFIASAKAQ